MGSKITEQQFIEDLQKTAKKTGEPLTQKKYREHGNYSVQIANKRFGGWNAAKQEAGIKTTEKGKHKETVSDDQLIEDLLRVNEEVEGKLTSPKYRKKGNYGLSTIEQRFKSWNKGKEAAGLETEEVNHGNVHTISEQELKKDLEKVAKNTEGAVTVEKYHEHGEYSSQTYTRNFGSWNEAKEAAGLETIEQWSGKGSIKYSEDELKSELRKAWMNQENGVLTREAFEEETGIHHAVLAYRFGSYKGAKDAAGVNDWEMLAEILADKLYEESVYGNYTRKDICELLGFEIAKRKFRGVIEYIDEEVDKIEVGRWSINSNQGCMSGFMRCSDKNFEEVMWGRYGDSVGDEYRDVFFKALSNGYSPQGTSAALYYLTSDVTQPEAADELGVSEVTVRNNRDNLLEMFSRERFESN